MLEINSQAIIKLILEKDNRANANMTLVASIWELDIVRIYLEANSRAD